MESVGGKDLVGGEDSHVVVGGMDTHGRIELSYDGVYLIVADFVELADRADDFVVFEGFKAYVRPCTREVLEQLRRQEDAVLKGMEVGAEGVALAYAGKGLLAQRYDSEEQERLCWAFTESRGMRIGCHGGREG